jgi:hypothetical protein
MTRILVFADSRGQHRPAGSSHKLFGERLKTEVAGTEVDLVLCPMKWTTTIDFFDYVDRFGVAQYDWIVLYTGIVDWSPRPQDSAFNDLYDNRNEANLTNWDSNTTDYSKKIVNNKKASFDALFGEVEINRYLQQPFETLYEGQPTINMYSREMAERVIGPRLATIPNLIFVNSNRLLPDWEGDFKRGRPKNISITHDYCDIVSRFVPETRLVDLRAWQGNDIKLYTCDNMHLTREGSDWIFERLLKIMGLRMKDSWETARAHFATGMQHDLQELVQFRKMERFAGDKAAAFLQSHKIEGHLATLIIGLKLQGEGDEPRLKNLDLLLRWIDYYFRDLFDILIVEQGAGPVLDRKPFEQYAGVRHEFLYNPEDYNRGWGYNVAVEHFCNAARVVVLMDTDVLPGSNFVAEVRDCWTGKSRITSPYQNIYYTDPAEVETIGATLSLSQLNDTAKIKNPVTITGGIVIVDRNTFREIKGFEQYIGYGCEDRSLDVMVLGTLAPTQIRIAPFAYVHLHHPTDKGARRNFKAIYDHLKANYRCEWSPDLRKTDFIHDRCQHVSREALTALLVRKSADFGDPDLYRSGAPLDPNGRRLRPPRRPRGILLPDAYTDHLGYAAKELYAAPEPDSSEIAELRNAFLGERCFIIGNGPSLNRHDLSLLRSEYSFGVNSFYYKTRETGFRPTFYVVEDSSVMKENLQEIKAYYAPFKFFPTVYKRLHPKTPNTFFFKMNRGFYERSSPNYCVPRFSTDATRELYCGQSVTYINLQLAYYLGFTEVYLIGMDFSYVIPESHQRTGDVLLSDTDDPNHFHKDYFGKGKTWKDPKLDRVAMNYRMAKLAYECTGRKIFNATKGGNLDIFERVDYDTLLGGPSAPATASAPSGPTFTEANALCREAKYAQAAEAYASLIEQRPGFRVYKQALFNAYLLAKESGQPVSENVESIMRRLL